MKNERGFIRDAGRDNTINEYAIENIEYKENIRKILNKKYNRKKYVFKTLKVKCQLYRGDTKFPRTAEMSLAELGNENRRLFLKHIKMLDDGKECPLYRYMVIDRERINSLLEKNMDISIHLDYEKGEILL